MFRRFYRACCDFLRDEEGTATIEATIMLPVYIIIFGAIIYLSQGFESKLETAAELRGQSWRYAMDNCSGSRPGSEDRTEHIDNPEVEEAATQIDAIEANTGLPSIAGILDDLLGDSLFPKEYRFTATRDVNKPTVLGGGTVSTDWEITIMCNERPKDLDLFDMASELFGDVL